MTTHTHVAEYATPAENLVINSGARVTFWNPNRNGYDSATLTTHTTLYPLREQSAPSPFVHPECIGRDARHTFTVGRLYFSPTVPVIAFVHAVSTRPRGRGRTPAPAFDRNGYMEWPSIGATNTTHDTTTTTAVDELLPSPITPSPEPMPTTPATTPAVAPDTAAALAQLLATLTPSAPAIPAELVARIEACETAVKNIAAPLRIEIVRSADDPTPTPIGVQHHEFPTLLATVQTRLPNGRRVMPWLVGPAGTGKTKAAAGVADALGVPFCLVGTLTDAFQVLGYMDARGVYVSTPFRAAWEHGGVILLDESDRADSHATVALLGGLDSGVMQFPDARVPMHADTVVIAAGNTTGTGATAQFRAAKAQDSAFADRFVFLDWPHDDALESALSTNPAWLRYVRAVRAEVRARKLPEQGFDITTRATLDGAALLAAGVAPSAVVSMAVRRRIPPTTWAEICAKVAPFTGGK